MVDLCLPKHQRSSLIDLKIEASLASSMTGSSLFWEVQPSSQKSNQIQKLISSDLSYSTQKVCPCPAFSTVVARSTYYSVWRWTNFVNDVDITSTPSSPSWLLLRLWMKKLLAIRSSVTMVDQMVQYQCGESTATQIDYYWYSDPYTRLHTTYIPVQRYWEVMYSEKFIGF